jgi:hypothetical protein
MNTFSSKFSVPALIAVACVVVITGLLIFKGLGENGSQSAVVSSPASLSLLTPAPQGAIEAGAAQHVTWSSQNYAAPTVSVNVIRKVSDNPATYEPVRTIALAKSNNGDALWVPAKADVGDNTLLQLGCTVSAQECTADVSHSVFAVIDDGRYDNMASVYQAVEALYNAR